MKNNFRDAKCCATCEFSINHILDEETEYMCNFDGTFKKFETIDKYVDWYANHCVEPNNICDDYEDREHL